MQFCTLILLFVANSWTIGLSQVTDTDARDQPETVWFPHSSECCNFKDSPQELMTCVNKVNPLQEVESVTAIVTYASRSIFEYASYALGVNSIYCEHNKYEFRIQTAENGNNFEPDDQRWNKVKILSNALDPVTGWAKDVEYIVWVDADLVIMDLGFRLELVGRAYPDADLIMSNDLGGSEDFANSGLVIVKNTPWARAFLEQWWDCERIRMSDQMAFLMAAKKLDPKEEKKKIKLLPIDAVNTHFPPWSFQRDCNQVLHLAGEPDSYRRVVFGKGFQAICGAIDPLVDGERRIGARNIPRQLGLTREVLHRFHMQKGDLRLAELQELSTQAHQGLADMQFADMSTKWEFISRVKGKVSNLLKDAEGDAKAEGVRQLFYGHTMELLLWCFSHLKELSLTAYRELNGRKSTSVGEYIRMTISTAYDVVDFHAGFRNLVSGSTVHKDNDLVALLEGVETDLLPIFRTILPSHLTAKAKYYELKFFQFLAAAKEMAGALPAEHLPVSYRAIEVWRELHSKYQYYGTDYISIDPYKEGSRLMADVAVQYCSDLGDVRTGSQLFSEAQGLMVRTLEEYDNTPLATVHNKADEVDALISAFTNSAICLLANDQVVPKAVEDLVTALNYIDWYENYSREKGETLPEHLSSIRARVTYSLQQTRKYLSQKKNTPNSREFTSDTESIDVEVNPQTDNIDLVPPSRTTTGKKTSNRMMRRKKKV